jgi:TonB family protein
LSFIHLKDTCKYCNDLDAAIRFFGDQYAMKYYFRICAKRDTLVENSDSIRKAFKGYSYTVVTRRYGDPASYRNYFDKHKQEIFGKIDQAPQFPGGDSAMRQFLNTRIKYPPIALNAGIKGEVTAVFVVRKDGKLSDIKISRGIGGGCDEELIRVMRLLPPWIPGSYKGIPVDARSVLTYTFDPARFMQQKDSMYVEDHSKDADYDNYLKGSLILDKFSIPKAKSAIFDLKKGTLALESKDYEKAISVLSSSINKFPFPDAFYNRGTAYYAVGDTCRFCQDMKIAMGMGDNEAHKQFRSKCSYITVNNTIPDSIKLMIPTAGYLETYHERYGNDSSVYIVSNRNGIEEDINLAEINYNDTFTEVEEMPSFPGGETAMQKFISQHLHQAKMDLKGKPINEAYIKFIIEKDGSVSNARIIKGVDENFVKAALHAVMSMPGWSPGKHLGKPVKVKRTMRVLYP